MNAFRWNVSKFSSVSRCIHAADSINDGRAGGRWVDERGISEAFDGITDCRSLHSTGIHGDTAEWQARRYRSALQQRENPPSMMRMMKWAQLLDVQLMPAKSTVSWRPTGHDYIHTYRTKGPHWPLTMLCELKVYSVTNSTTADRLMMTIWLEHVDCDIRRRNQAWFNVYQSCLGMWKKNNLSSTI